MSEIQIIRAKIPEEFTEIIDLWQASGPGIHLGLSDTLEEIEKKLLRDPELFLVAKLDGKIIGTVLGGFDGRRGMVYHLAVAKPFRKTGIGNRLLSALELEFRRVGCKRSYLLVTHENTIAQEMYRKYGWETLDLMVMGKDIK